MSSSSNTVFQSPTLRNSFQGMSKGSWLILVLLVALKVIEYIVVHARVDSRLLIFYPLFFLAGLWLAHQLVYALACYCGWSLRWSHVTEAYLVTSLVHVPLSFVRIGQALAGAEPFVPWAGILLKGIQMALFALWIITLYRSGPSKRSTSR